MSAIPPVYFSNYNDSDSAQRLVFKTSGTEIMIDTLFKTVATIRNLEVPINNPCTPINNTRSKFQIGIFNEYKPVDKVFPELGYGLNLFEIPGPIYSVQKFLDSVNAIVRDKCAPVSMGFFELDADNAISYNVDLSVASEYNQLKIYFDPKLQRLFEAEYDQADKIGELSRLNIVKDFTNVPGKVTSFRLGYTFPLFFNLKGIRLYSTLPTTGSIIYKESHSQGTSNSTQPLLMAITYNSMQMFNNKNLIYIPSTLFNVVLNSSTSTQRFEITPKYFYADGSEEDIFLDPLEYASLTITFDRLVPRENFSSKL